MKISGNPTNYTTGEKRLIYDFKRWLSVEAFKTVILINVNTLTAGCTDYNVRMLIPITYRGESFKSRGE